MQVGARWTDGQMWPASKGFGRTYGQIYSARQQDAFCPSATAHVTFPAGDRRNEIPGSLIKVHRKTVTRQRDEVRAWRADISTAFICHTRFNCSLPEAVLVCRSGRSAWHSERLRVNWCKLGIVCPLSLREGGKKHAHRWWTSRPVLHSPPAILLRE